MKSFIKRQNLLTNPLFISLFVFVLYLIITINRPMMCDEGMWHYIGRVWIDNDMPPYKFTIENKNPAIFELYAISHYLFGINYMFVRILGVLSIILTMTVILKITTKIHSRTAGIYAMYLYGLTSSWWLMDGQWPSVTENFMCLFTTLSLYCLISSSSKKKSSLYLILSGIFIGIAISFKQIAVFSLFGLIVYYIVNLPKPRSISHVVKSGFLMFTGFFIAIIWFLSPIFFSGVSLKEYLDGAWFILLNNGSYNQPVERLYLSIEVWFGSRFAIYWTIIPLILFQKDMLKKRYFIGLIILLFFDFVGANASGNLYGHQVKQIIPALVIISSVLLARLTIKIDKNVSHFKRNISIIIISIIIVFLPYKNLIINGYFNGFPESEKELGLWIKDNTLKEDKIFVVSLGESGQLLSYSERISASKYFNIIFAKEEKVKSKIFEDLEQQMPKYMIINCGCGKRWIACNERLMENYCYQFKHGYYEVYLLKVE